MNYDYVLKIETTKKTVFDHFFLPKGNNTNVPESYLSNLDSGWKVGFSLAYSLVLFLSLVGNSVVLHILRRNPSFRTATNLFMGNVSVANLLTNFTYHLVVILQIHIGKVWIGGQSGSVLCAMVRYFRGAFYLISVASLVIVSVEGYLSAMKSVRVNSTRQTILLLVLTWSAGLALTMPIAFKAEVKTYGEQFVCTVRKQDDVEILVSYIVFGFFFGFLVPLIVMILLYTVTGCKLWSLALSENHVSNQRNFLRKRKVTIAMAAIATAFVSCWFPLEGFAVHLSINTNGMAYSEGYRETLHHFLEFLCCFSSALVPWMNIVLNQNMHKNGKIGFACCTFQRFSCHRVNRITVKSINDCDSVFK